MVRSLACEVNDKVGNFAGRFHNGKRGAGQGERCALRPNYGNEILIQSSPNQKQVPPLRLG